MVSKTEEMDERINRITVLANLSAYDSEGTRKYIDGAPHIKHASLRRLYGKMLVQVYDFAKQHAENPTVLDLGAGEGSVTLPFLELGARVTAVDISRSQLDVLQDRCKQFADRLEVRCEDINNVLLDTDPKYSIIVANSFLHHIPDYIGLMRQAVGTLSDHGQFFTFQDPLRYDSVGRINMLFSNLAFFSWRIFKGDVLEGIKRRLRRSRGIYLSDSVHDNAEYHAARNGVDQNAICCFLKEQGFDCNIISYFSTPSCVFQPIGTALGAKNTFAVIARRKRP